MGEMFAAQTGVAKSTQFFRRKIASTRTKLCSTPIVVQQMPGMHIPRRGQRVRMRFTCVRVYSVRARVRAHVSVPLTRLCIGAFSTCLSRKASSSNELPDEMYI